MPQDITRRTALLSASAGALGTLAACDAVKLPGVDNDRRNAASGATTPPPPRTDTVSDVFQYEVTYTDAEWRSRLSPAEYQILRANGTEQRHSHRFTQKTDTGTYSCKGCDLPVYLSEQKINLDIGWVFFRHALPDSTLFNQEDDGRIEAHCRRCGSHLGHVLYVEGQILHCINGTALGFKDA